MNLDMPEGSWKVGNIPEARSQPNLLNNSLIATKKEARRNHPQNILIMFMSTTTSATTSKTWQKMRTTMSIISN